MQRHRHQEFIRFLNTVEAEVPASKVIHVILDNYAAHKHPKVMAWLDRHPRWQFHFTPTSLQADIAAFIEAHNENPKPYKWVKSADEILASVKRFCQKTMKRTLDSGD